MTNEAVISYAEKLAVYQAQTANVRSLISAIKQVRRSINDGIRTKNEQATIFHTKVYALLFSAWAEALLMKILHTPYGFEPDEINQVKNEIRRHGISKGWNKMVLLGLRHIDPTRGNFKLNAQQKLERVIDRYVLDPSVLRNKLAHGQWEKSLNREMTALNADMTQTIRDLNIVKIDTWKQGFTLLSDLILTLIESPEKTFVVNWDAKVQDIEAHIIRASRITLAEHSARIRPPAKLAQNTL